MITDEEIGQELKLMATVARGIYQCYNLEKKTQLPVTHHNACMAFLYQMTLDIQHLYHVSYKKQVLEEMLKQLRDVKRDLISYQDTDKLQVSHILVLPFAHYDEDTDTRLQAV